MNPILKANGIVILENQVSTCDKNIHEAYGQITDLHDLNNFLVRKIVTTLLYTLCIDERKKELC